MQPPERLGAWVLERLAGHLGAVRRGQMGLEEARRVSAKLGRNGNAAALVIQRCWHWSRSRGALRRQRRGLEGKWRACVLSRDTLARARAELARMRDGDALG